jgi:ubiquinone biosynthesis protein Coq4
VLYPSQGSHAWDILRDICCDTDELAYVVTRTREVHDFWHVLFGLPTNLIGETALKVIEFEQMFLPVCMLSCWGLCKAQ